MSNIERESFMPLVWSIAMSCGMKGAEILPAKPVMTPIEVPANASRFFGSRSDALAQPTAMVQLSWDAENPFLVNQRFDAALIRHDSHYCTSVVDLNRIQQLPTLKHIGVSLSLIAGFKSRNIKVADVGCGQGEFVEALRERGIDACGFDPVLRTESKHLHQRYWIPEHETRVDLIVMRCVLPHIERPWDFLDRIAEAQPGALVLVEFQRLEWILDQRIWYQLSHDHVNVFSVRDFATRYDIAAQGQFSKGEWAWVLLDPATRRHTKPTEFPHQFKLTDLLAQRDQFLEEASKVSRCLAVWGAAGKGIVLSHALVNAGTRRVEAIDADPLRWGKYLDGSGVLVHPPGSTEEVARDAVVVVSNPNHLTAVRRAVPSHKVVLPRDFGGPPPF